MAFGVKTNERPGTRAELRYARFSAYKAREVLNLIRGKTVAEAAAILEFTERGASEPILKVLNSAVANAGHNDGIAAEELFVSACFADEGPTLKRFRPRARGRAGRIRKRTCHVTVIVSRLSPEQLEIERAKSSRRGQATNVAASRARRVASSRRSGEAAETPADAGDEGVEPTEAAAATVEAQTAPYGDGSAAPTEDGSAPEGYDIKGNADSMLYHTPDSPHYERTIAEVWFATVEAAEAAGFAAPGSGTGDEQSDDAAEGEN